MVGLELVQRSETDARLVMQWRNDPATLQASFNQTPKEWESFWPEFQQTYFSTLYLPPLFALHEKERVAFIRFRPMNDSNQPLRRGCDISLNIAPEHRGKGLATPILRAALDFLRAQGIDDCYAEIKSGNAPSQNAFAKAGFALLHSGEVSKSVVRLTPLSSPSVFVIAEAGSNWRMGHEKRDLAMAKALIEVAVDAGADAVKFQTYHPDGVYVPTAGKSDYLADAGIQEEIRDIFADLAMPYEMIPRIAEECKRQGIEFMATPFSPADFAAVDPYVSIHKIASYELSHLRLLQLAARSGKPLIMSTGAAMPSDIHWAVDTFRKAGGSDLTLLQCTAKYPAPLTSLNLRVLPWLQAEFGVNVGLSDHSRDPMRAPAAAVALGARVIEKHYTLDNRLPGPDHSFALTPPELKAMVVAIRETEQALGTGVKEVHGAEEELYQFARRGLQAIRDIEIGEELVEGLNVAILRPGKQKLGCHPRHIESAAGQPAKRALKVGEGLQQGDW